MAASRPSDAPDGPEHYFSERPAARSRPGRVRVAARGLHFELASDRGTFSPTRLDPGTAFLLAAAPDPPATGRFLDLGCGYGPIACTLASRRPDAQVWAVDVNERALALTAANAEALGLANIKTVAPPDVPPELAVDLIWSNPPIRIGKPALHELLSGWLKRLSPTGAAVLVVQKHLGSDSLQRWLDAEGWLTERIGSRAGYRLMLLRPSPDPSAA